MIHVPAVVLARGGSKGIPNKNIMEFAGKPLLAWTILQARSAKSVTDTYVSSDDEKILSVATQYGAVPILRPKALSTDSASSESGWLHALDFIRERQGHDPDVMLTLQVTSPLRESSDIDGAMDAFFSQNADSLFTDAELDDLCAWTEQDGVLMGKTYDPFNRGRRQDRKPLYLENGSLYVFRTRLLRETGNRIGGKIARYTMAYWKSFEIDSMENFELCEYYFRKNLLASAQSDATGFRFDPALIVYDFDGVMTDNRVLILQDGSEGVMANRGDGWGIAVLKRNGFRQVILSTETSPVVSARGAKLGIEVVQGCSDKAADLSSFCANNAIPLERVLYVGNDVNDLVAMQIVGYPVAPADSHPDVLAIARLVTTARGGHGVIREISDLLIRSKNSVPHTV